MCRKFFIRIILTVPIFSAVLVVSSLTFARAAGPVDVTGAGTGVFIPSTGLFYGTGDGSLLGERFFNGVVELDQFDFANPLKPIAFKNPGQGTRREKFQEIIATDGSSLSLRFEGMVQLAPAEPPEDSPEDSPEDPWFTATWLGDFAIASGTGRFKGAKGTFAVVAINKPFRLKDPAWEFGWTWEGQVRLKPNALRNYSILTTEGLGAFDPANLGLGDPEKFPELIIGDGSGLAIYDGTPTGDNFRLDGILVASGEDQHFGTAQSLTLGVLTSAGAVQFPGTDGNENRGIHRMVTDIGELWLKKNYYFELGPNATGDIDLTAPVDFRVVGGTGLYRGAKGSIFCFVDIDLPAVDPAATPVVAPFHYDFDGYVELKPLNRIVLRFLQWFWQFLG